MEHGVDSGWNTLLRKYSNAALLAWWGVPLLGARCNARWNAYDPEKRVYMYNFIDNGLIYSEGGCEIFSRSMTGGGLTENY